MFKLSVVPSAAQSMTETLGRLVNMRINIGCGFRPMRIGSRDNRSWTNACSIGYRRYKVSQARTLKVQEHTHEGQYAQENR